jgi:RNA-binding protein
MLPDQISPDETEEEKLEGDAGGEEPGEGKVAKAKLSANLTGKQKRFLRAKGHLLAAVLHIGKEGVSDSLVKNALVQLEAHELIKVKVGEGAPENRHRTAEALAAATQSELAQVLGRTFLIYKARKKKPEIKLPQPKE